MLPGGNFETLAKRPEEIWHLIDPPPLPTDDVELLAQRVSEVTQPELTKKDGPAKGGKSPRADQPRSGDSDRAPTVATLVKGRPREGKQCAMLTIAPRTAGVVPKTLERSVLALTSPEVRLAPGTVVRISGWVCIPKPIAATPDGALLYDNSTGDAFAIRLLSPTPWKQFTVYRRVPASGVMQLTLALTGVGTVYFDDIRMEPLLTPGSAAQSTASATPTR